MTWPKHRVLLLAIFCLGLTIRLIHFWAIADTAFPELPLVMDQSDMFANVEWARTILAGDWLGRSTYHPYFPWMRERGTPEAWYRWWGGQTIFQQSPFYPYWVAGWFALLGESLTGILFVQLVLGALDSLVIYLLARRLFNVHVGLLAAGMTALYGPFIFHQATLLRDWLPPILEPLALLAILHARETERLRDWFLAGAAMGVAILVKESLLLFLPLVLLWLLAQYRAVWPHAARGGLALLVGLTVVLTPLLVRNIMVDAPVLSISNRAAEGFIEGNAPDSEPLGFNVPASLPGILDRANGSFATVIRETLGLYHGDWPAFLKLLAYKLRGLTDWIEIPNNLEYRYGQEISPILRLTLGYGVIFPIGLAGLLLSLRALPGHGLLLLYGLSTLVALLLTIVIARYRLVLVPVLIIYAAFALVQMADAIRLYQWRIGLTGVSLIAALAILQHVISPIPWLRTNLATAYHYMEYFYSARIYASEKEYERGATELVRMRQRIEVIPVVEKDLEKKVITMSVALEREGYLRVLAANQLFEQADSQRALEMADMAKRAYMQHYQVIHDYLHTQPDPNLTRDMATTPQFFSALLSIRDASEAPAIRSLLEWLEKRPS